MAHGLDVKRNIERQEVCEGIHRHAIRDERRPLGLHQEEFRGDRLSQQR